MEFPKQFVNQKDLNLVDFEAICQKRVNLADFHFAQEVKQNLPLYRGQDLLEIYLSNDEKKVIALKSELNDLLRDGPGALVIKNFFKKLDVIDKNNETFYEIIAHEKETLKSKGDHFASPNANDRIWNSYEKTCSRAPLVFFEYYKNPLFNLIHEAWLGPHYQITAQVNVVKPGGKAQVAHRDYHLGFQNNETIAKFPLNIQIASQFLTLQGAIAHCDMPLEAGPTYLLPFSQLYQLGYLAFREKAFTGFFEENFVQLPLEKGDGLFFNPALYHAAGENKTKDINRIGNLIQTSSAFGKAMENIDRLKMLKQLYPIIKENQQDPDMKYFIKNIADGYSFPTNLDRNPPTKGNTPTSMLDLLTISLQENKTLTEFSAAMDDLCQRNASA